MICQRCGTELPDNYKFCIKCGANIAQFMQGRPVPPANSAPPPAPRHFTLDDIARQQQEKNETHLGLTPQPQPQTPPPQPAPKKPEPAKQSSSESTEHSISGPAVPMGLQTQVRFSIFAPDAAQRLEKLKAENN